jgi:hypothetical protein
LEDREQRTIGSMLDGQTLRLRDLTVVGYAGAWSRRTWTPPFRLAAPVLSAATRKEHDGLRRVAVFSSFPKRPKMPSQSWITRRDLAVGFLRPVAGASRALSAVSRRRLGKVK